MSQKLSLLFRMVKQNLLGVLIRLRFCLCKVDWRTNYQAIPFLSEYIHVHLRKKRKQEVIKIVQHYENIPIQIY